MSDSSQEKTVRFCSYCGTKLDLGAKFCKNCGEAIENSTTNKTNGGTTHTENQNRENPTERKTVYEGYVHKCPNCGEVLEAFVSNCPSCGYEIRGTVSTHSVREFALRLERIEAQKMPPFQGKKSIMKTVFGKDFDDKDDAEEAKEQFEEQKQQEKSNLIINFSVPNTKEDILEFMILAASNINVKKGIDDEVTKAWIAKLEQVYQRAQITMGNSRDFAAIKNIYDAKSSELKNRKFKGLATASFIVGGYALLMGVIFFPAENPVAGVILTLIGIVLLLAGIKFISIYHKNNKHHL